MTGDSTGGRTPQQEALAAEIERTRQDLGETVEALAAKADLKAQARRRAARAAAALRAHRGAAAAAGGAGAAALLAWLAARRRRR